MLVTDLLEARADSPPPGDLPSLGLLLGRGEGHIVGTQERGHGASTFSLRCSETVYKIVFNFMCRSSDVD